MIRNNSIKADLLRELTQTVANEKLQEEDDGTTHSYSGNTTPARENTLTNAHSTGTMFAKADPKINQAKLTSSSEDKPPDLNSRDSKKDAHS